MTGAIVVDKPLGWTSHDVVNKIRKLAKTRRVGHLGTLDPAATGVLPLVIGSATRLTQFYAQSDKVYDAVIHFGWATDTYDVEGQPITDKNEPEELDRQRLQEIIARYRGRIQQMPPPISAKKIHGKPAYKLARRKLPVELRPVEVEIYSFELLETHGPEARVLVHCSAGTYLRTIAHDLGQAYGTGAFLKSLVRTRCAHFDLERAWKIEQLEELAREDRLYEAVIPAAELLPQFPAQVVDRITASQIRQGRDFRTSPFLIQTPAKYVKAISESGELLAIGEARMPNLYHPIVVL